MKISLTIDLVNNENKIDKQNSIFKLLAFDASFASVRKRMCTEPYFKHHMKENGHGALHQTSYGRGNPASINFIDEV